MFDIGDVAMLTKDIYEEGEDLPPGYIAWRGDVVVVQKVASVAEQERYAYLAERPYAVSHHGAKGCFRVSPDEITLVQGSTT